MDKKLIVVLVIVAIILLGVFAYVYSGNGGKFGSSTVKAPKGFTQKAEKDNGVVLTNKNTTIHINENHNKSIDEIITNYKNKYPNDTVVEETRNVGNVSVRAVTLKQANKTVHTNYYYQKNGIIYHIFMTGKNNQTALDGVVNSTAKSKLPF